MSDYDPKSYWNTKAKSASGNANLAACGANPHENRCIESSQKHALAKALSFIEGKSIAGKNILDFGCGSGRWTNYFTALGANYSGIDISEEMVSLSQQQYPDQNYKSFDGVNLPFDSNSFDLVYSLAVIHHNRPPQQEEIIKEITRVLKPGGYLFLFEGLGTVHHERLFPRTMDDWITMVKSQGFSNLMRIGYCYYILTDTMNSIARKLHIPRIYYWRPAWLLGLDSMISPLISPYFPASFHNRGAMLFRRTEHQ